MEIKFASDLIKITFEDNEPFAGRALMMYGEVLDKGFAAITSTMSWLSPNKGEVISDDDRETVRKLFFDHNQNNNFRVKLIEE